MKVKGWISGALTALAIALLIYSCENKSIPVPVVSVPSGCDTNSVTFSSGTNTLQPIINAQCGTNNNSCHSARTAYNYTTYAGVFANYQNGTLKSCLFQGTPFSMPQTPQPGWSDSSGCMLAKFKAWINAGAPQ